MYIVHTQIYTKREMEQHLHQQAANTKNQTEWRHGVQFEKYRTYSRIVNTNTINPNYILANIKILNAKNGWHIKPLIHKTRFIFYITIARQTIAQKPEQ